MLLLNRTLPAATAKLSYELQALRQNRSDTESLEATSEGLAFHNPSLAASILSDLRSPNNVNASTITRMRVGELCEVAQLILCAANRATNLAVRRSMMLYLEVALAAMTSRLMKGTNE